MSSAQFRRDFAAIVQRTNDKTELACRKVVADLASQLIQRSPVLTGRFRGNWQFGLASVNTGTGSGNDASGSAFVARATGGMGGWRPGQSVYLTNSLPYARPLEYGSSKQAPNGMVRVTVANYQPTLEKIVRALR